MFLENRREITFQWDDFYARIDSGFNAPNKFDLAGCDEGLLAWLSRLFCPA